MKYAFYFIYLPVSPKALSSDDIYVGSFSFILAWAKRTYILFFLKEILCLVLYWITLDGLLRCSFSYLS